MTVDVWAAMKNFSLLKSGTITVYLRDFDGANASTIAQGSVAVTGSAAWSQKTLSFNAGSYTLPAGHRLEIKLTADGSSGDDIWFAYDTISFPGRVKINQ